MLLLPMPSDRTLLPRRLTEVRSPRECGVTSPVRRVPRVQGSAPRADTPTLAFLVLFAGQLLAGADAHGIPFLPGADRGKLPQIDVLRHRRHGPAAEGTARLQHDRENGARFLSRRAAAELPAQNEADGTDRVPACGSVERNRDIHGEGPLVESGEAQGLVLGGVEEEGDAAGCRGEAGTHDVNLAAGSPARRIQRDRRDRLRDGGTRAEDRETQQPG